MNSTSEYLFTKPIMNMIRITACLLCPANNQVGLDKTQLLSKLLDMREQRNWNFNKKISFLFLMFLTTGYEEWTEKIREDNYT